MKEVTEIGWKEDGERSKMKRQEEVKRSKIREKRE